jgi:inosose dehydratase
MGKQNQIQLGVSPLSWTNDVLAELGGDIPLETCLQDAAEIGYEGV